jgi:hypothetical protein
MIGHVRPGTGETHLRFPKARHPGESRNDAIYGILTQPRAFDDAIAASTTFWIS